MSITPNSDAHQQRLVGQLCFQQGDFAGAVSAFGAALKIEPQHRETLRAVAACYLNLNRARQAAEIFHQLSSAYPDDADASFDLGVGLEACGDQAGAKAAYEAALSGKPDHFGARLNLCALLLCTSDFSAAEKEGRCLIDLHPNQPDSWCNLAQALFANALYDDAERALQQALKIAPDHLPARFAHVAALAMLGNTETALAELRLLRELRISDQMLASIPGATEIWHLDADALVLVHLTALFERFRQGEWEYLAPLREGLSQLAMRLRNGETQRVLPIQAFHALAVGVSHDNYLSLVSAVSSGIALSVPPLPVSPPRLRTRLRIGYMSPAFREHPNAYLFRRIFAAHHRDRFEVFAYSLGADDKSAVRHEIIEGCDQFVDLSRLSDTQAAALIQDDDIDILIDLQGYFENTRPAIIAARPARLQVSYAGFLGIVEAPFIDYRLADRVTDGEFAGAAFRHEQPAYLPGCFFPYGCPGAPFSLDTTRAAHGLPAKSFVFCAFNNDYKLAPDSFFAWMEILRAVPDSVLWLIAGSDRHFNALCRHAERIGVTANRLVRAARQPNDLHLARHRLADLYLDAFAYNGHTTVLDALWMGLPVLTRSGASPAARLATSALTELGLSDLAMPDTPAYVARAVVLARSPAELALIRRRLEDGRRTASLFNPARKASQLECAYVQMWDRYCRGHPPAPFDVTEG